MRRSNWVLLGAVAVVGTLWWVVQRSTAEPVYVERSSVTYVASLEPEEEATSDETARPEQPLPRGERSVASASTVTVERLADGDSLWLQIDGVSTEVRIRGINALELNDCGGKEARNELEVLLSEGKIGLAGSQTDRYGRLLVDLTVDGNDVGAEMVKRGWALGYHGDGRYIRATEQAAEGKVGWWGLDCDPGFSVGLALGAIQHDPPGRDDRVLNEEWVEVVNPTPNTVDLASWVLRDETTGNHFRLPAYDLAAGATVTVRSGRGTDGEGNIFLGRDRAVWSNRGETVLLLDPSGSVVDYRFIS